MNITNKTKRPLRIPLPGAKTLFLAPGRTGQIAPKARQHPPLVALIDAGDVEIDDEQDSSHASETRKADRVRSSGGHDAGGGIRKTGDR